ncbi:DUF4265 domain-containing protein [Streptomyces antibioticus]|uniref:DUF4265 domain-containing protein n=1 Tax=Streptomyces antibioticus TaxID=1890 RepID=UPI0036D9AA54
MTNISDDHVKVHFRVEIDEDGWPPTSVETLWVVDLGDGTARLDNTPWFVRGVASGDIIRVQQDGDGVLWAGETVWASQNCTIRMVGLDVPPQANLPKIRELLEHGAPRTPDSHLCGGSPAHGR